MQKMYIIGITVGVAAVAVAVAVAVVSYTQSQYSVNILVSLEKPTVNYGDTQTWSVKGLPPNADYIATIRFADTALIVNIGTADVNGEATDSFVIGPNIPPGTLAFRIEIASDPGTFDEITLNLVP